MPDVALTDGFRATADVLPEPMLLVAADGRIVCVNRAFAREFGWTEADLLPRSLLDFLPSDHGAFQAYLRHCAGGAEILPGSVTFLNRDGQPVVCRLEGALFAAGAVDSDAVLLLRLSTAGPGEMAGAMADRINELGLEIARRRAAEEAAAAALERQRDLRDRLSALTEASGALFASLSTTDVLSAIGSLAGRLFRGDAFALWRQDAETEVWRIVWRQGLSDRFVDASYVVESPGAQPPRDTPVLVTDIDRVPGLADRREAYRAEGIESLVMVPLRIAQRTRATVVVYYRQPREFDESDVRVATALGNLGSSALGTSLLYEAESRSREASEAAEHRAGFLARAGAALATSLDHEATLGTMVRLAVPEIADWCAVDILLPGGELRRLAAASLNGSGDERGAHASAGPTRLDDHPIAQVIRTRVPAMTAAVDERWIRAVAGDDRLAGRLRELRLTSSMTVPLVARGFALGALTFARGRGRLYDDDDLRFAEDVASRAAMAVENARAYEAVRQANRLKDDFLATLSHELRTPLNAVLGYIRMLRIGALPADRRSSAIETIERNASALRQLVEDVLDVSRIEAGKIRLNIQRVDLEAVIHASTATVAPAADAKGVRLDIAIDPGLPPVRGDADRLQQIVWNLLANAVKFTARGGRVHLHLSYTDAAVTIEVADTGSGISAEFLPQVFERFRQADSHFTRERGGLGLGLAITRHLVEMHGGSVRAASAGVGHGATFTVDLPLGGTAADRESPPAAAESVDRPLDQPATTLADLTGISVLVVDDDADALALARQVLESAGATVATASSGAQALDALRVRAADLLVADIGMPGMDGFQLIAAVRAADDPRISGIPAAAVTAYARPHDRMRALEEGFQTHLAKPYDPGQFTAVVRRLARRG